MTKHTLFASLIALIAVLGSGCESASISDDTPKALVSIPPFVTIEPDGYVRPTDLAAREAAFQASVDYRLRLREAITNAAGWKDADAAVRAVMAETTDVPDFLKEQFAGYYMLQAELLTADGTMERDRQEAVGRYTELLVANRNPNAELVDRALGALEGYWPEARIAQTARAAYGAAEHFVEVNAECVDCGLAAARLKAAGENREAVKSLALREATGGADLLAQRF